MNNNKTIFDIRQANVLVVDDEPVNVKLLEKIFSAEGYQKVVSTTDPRTVLDLCRATPFDIILLDLNMPHLDGFGVLALLVEEFGIVMPPVLVLTAQHDKEHRHRALQGGARDYLTKPFDRIELLYRVRNIIEAQLFHRFERDQKSLLEELVQQRTQELHDSRLEIVQRLGRAAEYRDNETGMHIIRMSKFCEALARHIGLDSPTCDLLLNAAPMHDIGKIGIPDHVLLKPGKLTEEEYEIMKTHTTIGYELLSGNESELLVTARDIAVTHHEKWDGTGYPNGVAGENISLLGRITAVADVFDALTSSRPYKKAWALDDAFNFIREQGGRHFDPQLSEAFLDIRDQIELIRSAHLDDEGAC